MKLSKNIELFQRGRKNNIYKDIYKNFDYQPYDDDLYNEEYKQMNSTEMASGARVWFDRTRLWSLIRY